MAKVQKQFSVFALSILFTFIVLYLMFAATTGSASGGLLVASIMATLTLLLGTITTAIQHQRQKAAFAEKQKTVDDMDVHQTRTIEIDLPFNIAFDIAMEALETLDGEQIPKTLSGLPTKQVLKIHKADSGIGRIEAGLQAKTAGIKDFFDFSRIEIQLQRLDNNTSRLQIESRPANSLEIYDLGRHAHYVNHLALAIRKASRDSIAEGNLRENSENETISDEIPDSRKRLQDSDS